MHSQQINNGALAIMANCKTSWNVKKLFLLLNLNLLLMLLIVKSLKGQTTVMVQAKLPVVKGKGVKDGLP